MSTSGQPGLPPPPAPQSDQTRELLTFLREENEANRATVREDAQASRELLRFTVWLVALPITALILVVGWFGFKSLSDLKESLEREAQQSTKAEIVRMQEDIHNRLDQEFQTPRLQQMVKATAAEYTKTAAEPLIKSEVATQVKAGVESERPAIAKAVALQTHAAVRDMEPQINTVIKDSVEAKVTGAVAPLQQTIAGLKTEVEPLTQSLDALKAETNVQHLVARMKSDDASAYDQAVVLSNQTSDPETRSFLEAAIGDVMQERENNLRIARKFNMPHTEEQTLAELSSPDALTRLTVLDILGQSPKLSLSKLIELATSDPSLSVRCTAGQTINGRAKQQIPCLYKQLFVMWWDANKQKPEYQQK